MTSDEEILKEVFEDENIIGDEFYIEDLFGDDLPLVRSLLKKAIKLAREDCADHDDATAYAMKYMEWKKRKQDELEFLKMLVSSPDIKPNWNIQVHRRIKSLETSEEIK